MAVPPSLQGGRALQAALTVTLEVPVLEGLKLDHEVVRKKAAAEVGKRIRSAMKQGRQVDGKPMEAGQDGGPPMKDSGRTIREVKYDKRDQSVRPSTWPRSDLKPRPKKTASGVVVMQRRVTSSFGLFMVHLVGHMKRQGRIVSRVKLPDIGDPLGSISYWPEHIGEVVQRALEGVRVELRQRGTRRISKR